MSEIIPYLWNENLVLKKETFLWVERTIRVSEITDEGRKDYLSTRARIDQDGGAGN